MTDKRVWRRDVLRTVSVAALGVAGSGVYSSTAAGEDSQSGSLDSPASQGIGTADGWEQVSKMAPDDGDSFDVFGSSVAVSSDGTTAIIGAVNDEDPNGAINNNSGGAGSAYVFSDSGRGWAQQAKLAADDGDSGDKFGVSVAVSNDGGTAIIGAYEDDAPNGNQAGSAYVFSEADGSWAQQAKLAADDGDDDDFFGESVAVSGDGTTAIIGARNDEDPNGEEAGSAYVFSQSGRTWTQQAKLAADDGDAGDKFGWSVAVSGDGTTAITGARNDEDPNGKDGLFAGGAGSAYVFSEVDGSWIQQAKLAADDGDGGDQFGSSVAMSGDGTTAIIGAFGDEAPNGEEGAGSAYVFSEADGSWTQQAKLAADDGDHEDHFGNSVAVSGDGTTAIIGAWGEDSNGSEAGSAYVFGESASSWTRKSKLAAADGGGQFGWSVAVSGDGTTAIIGANLEDTNGENAGSAYVFGGSSGGVREDVATPGTPSERTTTDTSGGDPVTDTPDGGESASTSGGDQPAETARRDGDDDQPNGEGEDNTATGFGPGFGAPAALTALGIGAYYRFRNTDDE